MSQSVQLISSSNQVVIGHIVPMEQHHYDEVNAIWKPILVATEQPDAGWIWDYKLRQTQRDERYEAYVLLVDEFPQGLLFLETRWHRSHWTQRWPLVYVEAIATAPWNRTVIEQPPWFKRVGASLLLFARQRSVDLGYEGRVGLHSLPDAESFYRKRGMTEHGPDPEKEDLVYFEYNAIPSQLPET